MNPITSTIKKELSREKEPICQSATSINTNKRKSLKAHTELNSQLKALVLGKD